MSDERIRAVLRRAAEDRAFHDALMENREAALDSLDAPMLTPAEKAILMAPTRAQLRKMVEAARRRPWYSFSPRLAAGIVAGGVLAAGIVVPPLLTAGTRPSDALSARRTLQTIAHAERVYRAEFGSYGSLDALAESRFIVLDNKHAYRVEIEADADTFTATARHRTRPRTRPAFQVGPDGEVKQLE